MTNEQNVLLWKHLDGKTEFEHENRLKPGIQKLCSKCEHYYEKGSRNGSEPCLAADKYPGTDADIAEKIRQWAEKADAGTQDRYWDILQEGFTHRKRKADNDMGWFFGGWVTFCCTPADKIAAFLEVVKP